MNGVHPKLRNIQMSKLDCKYTYAPYQNISEGERLNEGIKLNIESRLCCWKWEIGHKNIILLRLKQPPSKEQQQQQKHTSISSNAISLKE